MFAFKQLRATASAWLSFSKFSIELANFVAIFRYLKLRKFLDNGNFLSVSHTTILYRGVYNVVSKNIQITLANLFTFAKEHTQGC